MRSYKIIALLLISFCRIHAQQTIIKYLSGTDKDHTVDWDFFCTEGARSGSWTKIPVPSNWEMQGFGGYNYGHEKNKHKEHGLYRYHFNADKKWRSKQIELVFEAAMTDVEVKINGEVVGPVHQGGFYQFSYNITRFLKFGEDNTLEADVSKMSADSSVNRAEREGDFWVFGGIYRPVYLKILPETSIERVAIDAKADGNLNMDVFFNGLEKGDEVVAQIKTLKGEKVGSPFSTRVEKIAEKYTLATSISHPQTWNPEFPNLYKAEVSIVRNNKVLHTIQQRFGFRTVEVRKGDGIYVNNTKVILKGVNRHSSWPESGRTLSRKIHLMDIGLIKDMNMNAVRMSHYPPDTEFLDLCDSLGLFVLDELTGWQKKYATPVGRKLVKELVARDVNHPSIIFWDNGNEGGFNFDLDNDYALYDPQQRTVLHPWSNFNNIDTKHYPDYPYIEKAAAKNDVLLHTEMIHGLYDGGHGAGLEDYWNLIRSNPRHAGGFLWVLADEGIVRHDKHDSIDTYGNNAPDGIVGPHREKEGSFYTIKEIWSPVQVTMPRFSPGFSGDIEVENNYHFTDLSQCSFIWRLISGKISWDGKPGHYVLASGKINIGLPPGQKKLVHIPLPKDFGHKGHASAIQFTAIDPYGRELYTWTNAQPVMPRNFKGLERTMLSVREKMNTPWRYVSENDSTLIITQDRISYHFNKTTGLLQAIVKENKPLPFGKGPVLTTEELKLARFTHRDSAGTNYHIVEAGFAGRNQLVTRWIFSPHDMLKLEYAYTQTDSADFYGIGFTANESSIKGMWWTGAGPYHVWKNRLKGVSVDTWYNAYNNTITGETFTYPEFKGYYADMDWVRIETDISPITIYFNDPGTYLQILHPARQKTNFNPFVNPAFPKTDIGFMDAIPPIGTKFKGAETMGPQSQKNPPVNGWISKSVWFEFW